MNKFIRFLLAGLANTALGYTVIFGCMYAGNMSPEFSNLAGYSVGFSASYILNRRFTFRSNGQRGIEFVRFLLVFVGAYFANFGALIFLIRILGVRADVSQIVAGAIYVATSYLLNKHYVFRASRAG